MYGGQNYREWDMRTIGTKGKIEGNAESEWKLRETEGESPLLWKGEWKEKCERRRPQFLVKFNPPGKVGNKAEI